QPSRKGRPLRSLGTTRAVFGRAARRLPVAPLDDRELGAPRPPLSPSLVTHAKSAIANVTPVPRCRRQRAASAGARFAGFSGPCWQVTLRSRQMAQLPRAGAGAVSHGHVPSVVLGGWRRGFPPKVLVVAGLWPHRAGDLDQPGGRVSAHAER